MASKKQVFRHLFGGGWSTDFGPSADVVPNAGGDVIFPFLVDAENVFYELDGGPHKIGGTTKLNSSAVASGAEIMGLTDFWRMGTGGTGTQRRVLHAGTVIMADNADGTFANIRTGRTEDAIPSYCTFDDQLIIGSTSTTDNPQAYDGTTCADLGGTAPRFSFACAHKNRVWAAGVAGTPSRLHYSALLAEDDWVGATAGSIDIDPSDGDRITAIVSHKNDLWVFKGPYYGSIHRITGSAPTGSDAFARIPFIRGLGAVWQNTIFRFRDDVGFMWSDGSLHSLNATAAFGDYNEAALSRPIHKYLREHINFAYLARSWAATNVQRSIVLITVPVDAGTFCNQILMMDYSRQDIRWSQWPALDATCVASVIDATDNSRPKLYIGGSDGFVRRTDVANRSIDAATSIAAKVTTPYTNYGNAMLMKTLSGAAVGIAQKNGDITFNWQCDTQSQQTATISQAGGNILGGGAGSFTLDDLTLGLLGGSQFVDKFIEEAHGEYRSVQFSITQNSVDGDMELHSISTLDEIGSLSMEN